LKLNYKYTLAYSILTFFVLIIAFTIVYATIRESGNQAMVAKLKHLNELEAKSIGNNNEEGTTAVSRNVTIEYLAQGDSLHKEDSIFF